MLNGKSKWLKAIYIIIFFLVIINLLGIMIEVLLGLGVVSLNLPITIRPLNFLTFFISIIYLVSGIILLKGIYNSSAKAIQWFDIFVLCILALNFYKVFNPTYIVALIPYYYAISFVTIILLWFFVRKYLRKSVY